jgi:outer membrane protein OmpA-like peptidoglycan-associated protein
MVSWAVADTRGSFAATLAPSQARAEAMRTSLLRSGAGYRRASSRPAGCSEVLPVACNADGAGRAKHRRVEVWLAPR